MVLSIQSLAKLQAINSVLSLSALSNQDSQTIENLKFQIFNYLIDTSVVGLSLNLQDQSMIFSNAQIQKLFSSGGTVSVTIKPEFDGKSFADVKEFLYKKYNTCYQELENQKNQNTPYPGDNWNAMFILPDNETILEIFKKFLAAHELSDSFIYAIGREHYGHIAYHFCEAQPYIVVELTDIDTKNSNDAWLDDAMELLRKLCGNAVAKTQSVNDTLQQWHLNNNIEYFHPDFEQLVSYQPKTEHLVELVNQDRHTYCGLCHEISIRDFEVKKDEILENEYIAVCSSCKGWLEVGDLEIK